jgi:hypothetical protein
MTSLPFTLRSALLCLAELCFPLLSQAVREQRMAQELTAAKRERDIYPIMRSRFDVLCCAALRCAVHCLGFAGCS